MKAPSRMAPTSPASSAHACDRFDGRFSSLIAEGRYRAR
jgi:hypothetical protein